jgi:hypothetical protein
MVMVLVLLLLYELSHGHSYESYTVVTFYSCILVVRCEHIQGKFTLAQMGNRSVVIDRMATSEEQFYVGYERIRLLACDTPVAAG